MVVCSSGGFFGVGGGGGCGRGGQRHDVCVVEGVLAGGEGGERCRGGEEQVAAEAVVGVDCVGGLEGDFLLGSWGGHGEVGAGGGGDVHGGVGEVDD